MNTEWSRTTRYIVGVGLALLIIYLLYLSRSVFPLLVIATLIAVIVRPLILWLHHRARLPRGAAVALVYLLVLFLVPLALLLAIPAIVDAVQYVLSLDYQSIVRGATDWLRVTLDGIKNWQIPIGGLDVYVDQMADAILVELEAEAAVEPVEPPSVSAVLQSLSQALTATFRTAAGVVGSVFSRFALTLFIFLTSIYISLTAHTFHEAFMRVVPERFVPETAILLSRMGRMWNAFFRGQLTLMLLIGVITWLGLTILGVPGAVYLGIVAGLLELIPNLGPVIATIPAVIVALLQGSDYLPLSQPVFALVVVLFYVLVQQLENNLIVPRVLGQAVDLPALVVMTGVLVGAEVGGLLGALLATPIIATLREVMRYAYRKIQGKDPFPPDEEPVASQEPATGTLVERLRRWLPFLKPRAERSLTQASPLIEAEKPGPRDRTRKSGAKIYPAKKK